MVTLIAQNWQLLLGHLDHTVYQLHCNWKVKHHSWDFITVITKYRAVSHTSNCQFQSFCFESLPNSCFLCYCRPTATRSCQPTALARHVRETKMFEILYRRMLCTFTCFCHVQLDKYEEKKKMGCRDKWRMIRGRSTAIQQYHLRLYCWVIGNLNVVKLHL